MIQWLKKDKIMLQKKESKTHTISSKLTPTQNHKLTKLAEKNNITKSDLVSQLIEIGYKHITKNKTF